MDYVRRAVSGMLYANDACIVSRSRRGLAKMMEVIVDIYRCSLLTVSESFNDWGGRRCKKIVPVVGGDGTKIVFSGTYLTNPLVK